MDMNIGVTGRNKIFLANVVLIIFCTLLEILFIIFLGKNPAILQKNLFLANFRGSYIENSAYSGVGHGHGI